MKSLRYIKSLRYVFCIGYVVFEQRLRVPVPVPDPDSGFRVPGSSFWISWFSYIPSSRPTNKSKYVLYNKNIIQLKIYLLCSLYSYLFVKGPHISSSILQWMQREGRRQIDVSHTSKTWIIHIFVPFWFLFRIPFPDSVSGFRSRTVSEHWFLISKPHLR